MKVSLPGHRAGAIRSRDRPFPGRGFLDLGKTRHDHWCPPRRDAINPAGRADAGAQCLDRLRRVSDLDTARQFYGETLGLPIIEESPFALVASANGTMLRLTAVEQPVTAPYTILGWRVADITSMIDQLTARGVHLTQYEGMGQDERGVWTAPGGAKIAVPRPGRQQLVPDGVRGTRVRKPRSLDTRPDRQPGG